MESMSPDDKDDKTPPDEDGQQDLSFDANAQDDAAPAPADDQAPPADATPDKKLEVSERRVKEAEDRAQRFERELEDLRRAQPRQTTSAEDKIRADEDAVLNDPKADDWAKWRVSTNRTLRDRDARVDLALAQAADISDRSSFGQLCAKNP